MCCMGCRMLRQFFYLNLHTQRDGIVEIVIELFAEIQRDKQKMWKWLSSRLDGNYFNISSETQKCHHLSRMRLIV